MPFGMLVGQGRNAGEIIVTDLLTANTELVDDLRHLEGFWSAVPEKTSHGNRNPSASS